MSINLGILWKASREVLGKKSYLLWFIAIALFILAVFIILPVITIPGNSFALQLTIFTLREYTLLSTLSLLTSLLIIMQAYLYRIGRAHNSGKALLGGGSGMIAALFGTAACASCLAAVFGFLGIGTVFFLVEYQWIVVSIAAFIMLIVLYFTSLRVVGLCKQCGVKR